jgi:hypothetical protein
MLDLEHLRHKPQQKRGSERSMEAVHMNKEEVAALEHIDGGDHRDKAGIREFKLPMFKNPHIAEHMVNHHHGHVAMGGEHGMPHHIKANRMDGRFGDTELVKIPRHAVHLFDRMIGGPSINPIDGKHEYFLGSLMGMAGNLFKAAAPAIGGAMRGMASGAARAIPAMARTAGSALASGARSAGSALASGAGRAASGLAGAGRAAATGLGNAARAAAPMARSAAGALGSGLKAVAKPVLETAASIGPAMYMHKKQMEAQQAMQREQMQQQQPQGAEAIDNMHDFGGDRGEYSSAGDIPVAPQYQGSAPPRAPQMTGLAGMGKRVAPYQEEQFYDARPYEGQ